jgi:hypothetical protein
MERQVHALVEDSAEAAKMGDAVGILSALYACVRV